MTVTSPSSLTWEESRRRVIPATIIGTLLEWFDVFLFAQAAALIFAPLFFPNASPAMGVIAAFATFGVGYVSRPLGAIIFGYVGDHYGRKISLVSTLVLMGVSTTLVGVLPTYGSIGILAPVLLVVLRLAQGLAAGAEYAGALVVVAEIAPSEKRGFWTALPGIGVYGGTLLAATIGATLYTQLPEDQLYSWGWRLPFLASILLVAVGMFLRLRLSESPVFKEVSRSNAIRKLPVVDVFRLAPKRLLLSIALTAPIAFNTYITITYGLTYSVDQGITKGQAAIGTMLAAATAILLVPLAGAMSDRFGRRRVFMVICAAAALAAFPYFALLSTGQAGYVWLAQVILVAPTVMALTGAQAAFLPELFEAKFRLSAVAMSRELCTAVLSSTSAVLAAALSLAIGGKPWLVATAMILVSLISLAACFALPETRGVDMSPGRDDPGENYSPEPSSADLA